MAENQSLDPLIMLDEECGFWSGGQAEAPTGRFGEQEAAAADQPSEGTVAVSQPGEQEPVPPEPQQLGGDVWYYRDVPEQLIAEGHLLGHRDFLESSVHVARIVEQQGQGCNPERTAATTFSSIIIWLVKQSDTETAEELKRTIKIPSQDLRGPIEDKPGYYVSTQAVHDLVVGLEVEKLSVEDIPGLGPAGLKILNTLFEKEVQSEFNTE